MTLPSVQVMAALAAADAGFASVALLMAYQEALRLLEEERQHAALLRLLLSESAWRVRP